MEELLHQLGGQLRLWPSPLACVLGAQPEALSSDSQMFSMQSSSRGTPHSSGLLLGPESIQHVLSSSNVSGIGPALSCRLEL